MKRLKALAALEAIAQAHRLDMFRLLVAAAPGGLAAGTISKRLRLAPNALTFHLDRLRDAGLIKVRREGRSMIYAAQYGTMNGLLAYLTGNCCQGNTEICTPVPFCDQRRSNDSCAPKNQCTPNSARRATKTKRNHLGEGRRLI
jgi:DNA-binding transcriptional ArsR family regulator